MDPTRYAKAIISALVAGLGTLATALADDGIRPVEWVWVAIAFLTALSAVAAVPNRPADPVVALADRDARRSDPLQDRLPDPPPPPVPDPGISERHGPGEHRKRIN